MHQVSHDVGFKGLVLWSHFCRLDVEGGWPHMLFAGRNSISATCQNLQNSVSCTYSCMWRYKPASEYLVFDYLLSIRSSHLGSGFTKAFIDILMLELGHTLVQNKRRDLDFR